MMSAMDGADTVGRARRRRYLGITLILLALLVIGGGLWLHHERRRIRAAARVAAIAKALGISHQAAERFNALGLRFGGVELEDLALSSLVLQVGSDKAARMFEKGMGQVGNALARSNVRDDLGAPPQLTGDELFDRYAAQVDQQIDALGYEGLADFDTAAVVPDDVLAKWESEFGDDPRYWELRYFCMKHSMPAPSVLEKAADPALRNQRGEDLDKALGFLEQARERGIATANTLMLLYWEKRDALQQDDPPGHDQLVYDYPPEAVEDLGQIANEAVAASHDEAWPYYTRAMYWYETGKPERGLADMKTGNTQPDVSYPVPFPAGMVDQGLSAPVPAGNAAVSGAIFCIALNEQPPILIKRACEASLAAHSLVDGSAAFETWHQFGCRLGASRIEEIVFSLEGIVYVFLARNAALDDQGLSADDPRRKTLGRILGAKEQQKDSLYARSRGFDMSAAVLPLAMAGKATGACVATYLDTQIKARANADVSLPIFKDLSEVHYPELEMTDSLKKYENVTIAELKERREKRRAAEMQAEEDGMVEEEGIGKQP